MIRDFLSDLARLTPEDRKVIIDLLAALARYAQPAPAPQPPAPPPDPEAAR